MADMDEIRRTAGIGGIDVAQPQAHVIRHVERAEAGRIAGAEIAVDVVLGQAGVVQCAFGHFGMQLGRSEEHTSELQSLMRISYAVFCLKKKTNTQETYSRITYQHVDRHYISIDSLRTYSTRLPRL